MRQDPFDRGVVERQCQVHAVEFASIISSSRRCSQRIDHRAAITAAGCGARPPPARSEHELVTTLFDLGRQVTSASSTSTSCSSRFPALIGRLISVRRVRRLPARRAARRAAHRLRGRLSGRRARRCRLKLGQGLVGAAVASEQPLLVNDLDADPRYVEFVPGMHSEIVVPLLHKSRPIGALNILSRNRDQFTAARRRDRAPVRARTSRSRSSTRGCSSAAAATPRRSRRWPRSAARSRRSSISTSCSRASRSSPSGVIDYRTFGILLLNDDQRARDEARGASTARRSTSRASGSAKAWSATPRCTRKPCSSPDVSQDPRYIKLVDDVRSELAIPLLLKDRCIGVFDLESPELDAFSKRDVEILTLLASQAAVAIENARLYEEVRANEERLEKEVRFAQRVQAALLPAGPPKRLKGVDVAAAFAPARELGGDFHDYPRARVEHAGRRGRRRLGQGRAGGALQRVCRGARARPHVPPPLPAGALEPGRRAVVGEHDPAPAAARGVLLHALLRGLRSEAADRDAGQLRPAVSDPLLGGRLRADRAAGRAARIVPRHRPTTR